MNYIKLQSSQISGIQSFLKTHSSKKVKSDKLDILSGIKKRSIYIPDDYTKTEQRKLLGYMGKIKFLDSVYSQKGKSYIDLVKSHSNENSILTLDISNFFPSINHLRIKAMFEGLIGSKSKSDILTRLTTVDNHLPLGYCTSPFLANLIFHPADVNINRYCKIHNLFYTRYVDDITISGKIINNDIIRKLQKIIRGVGLSLNIDKTKIYTPKDEKYILGLKLNQNGVDITEVFKEELLEEVQVLNTLISSSNDSETYADELSRLKGKLQFIKQVNKSSYKQVADTCSEVIKSILGI